MGGVAEAGALGLIVVAVPVGILEAGMSVVEAPAGMLEAGVLRAVLGGWCGRSLLGTSIGLPLGVSDIAAWPALLMTAARSFATLFLLAVFGLEGPAST